MRFRQLLFLDDTAQKNKFSVKDFFSRCDQIRSFLRIWSNILKKSLIENFIFCAVRPSTPSKDTNKISPVVLNDIKKDLIWYVNSQVEKLKALIDSEFITTVKSFYSGHLRFLNKCPL